MITDVKHLLLKTMEPISLLLYGLVTVAFHAALDKNIRKELQRSKAKPTDQQQK